MPEQPEAKKHLHPARAEAAAPAPAATPGAAVAALLAEGASGAEGAGRAATADAPAYAELYACSNFSFLRGASHPDELAAAAADLGYAALALTDEHSLAGVVRAHQAAKERGLPFVCGAEITIEDGPRAVLLARDRLGYGNLCRLLSSGRRRASKGACRLIASDLRRFHEGLLALFVPAETCLESRAGAAEIAAEHARLAPFVALFGDRCWIAAVLRDGPDEIGRLQRLERLEQLCGRPLVAAGAVEAHHPARRPLRDVLVAIRLGTPVSRLGRALPTWGMRSLLPRHVLRRLHAARPDVVARSVEIARLCTFSLDELRYEYPAEAEGRSLRELTYAEAARRWPEGMPAKVRAAVEHELELIAELAYESYFLTVYDLVRFARSRDILCQGRGSAANSAVCYCLGITAVDPSCFELLFERFVSRDRNEPPDIDVDFEHERREEVIQYVYERYGRERAALAATVISYRGRSAVRDVGKAMGLSLDQVDRLARGIGWRWNDDLVDERVREAGLDPDDAGVRRVLALVQEIQGFPRHLSQHVGGMVITRGRLDEMVPIENAAMDGRTVIQWDKDDLDALGLLKVDCLALGMLTALRKTFDLVAASGGTRYELATVPREAPEVYAMAERADTVGVFQIESRAQMAMLPRFKPRSFYDLVIEIAMVRPGPIQGGMVHPYLKRRAGREEVSYPSEEVRSVLERTLGVPIFQEQVMQLAVVAAGFTPGEADQLRRAMSSWRRHGNLDHFRRKLLAGMRERGYREDFAEAIYEQIRGFGEYGFPESHSASFAHLTYVSLWLKRFHPAAFCCALLNSLPMGFYGPAQLVADARAHGVTVRPVDVRFSSWDSTLETDLGVAAEASPAAAPDRWGAQGPALRLGLRRVKSLAEAAGRALLAARAERPFLDVEDCVSRSDLDRRAAAALAESGAFDGLARHRRVAWWQAKPLREQAPLFAAGSLLREVEPRLPAPGLSDLVHADYERCGLSLHAHPLELVRTELRRRRLLSSVDLAPIEHGRPVSVAGLCICRQKPATASGVLFMTLEDEHGFINVVVRRREQERFRSALLGTRLVLIKGILERVDGVMHVLTGYAEALDHLVHDLDPRARDFH